MNQTDEWFLFIINLYYCATFKYCSIAMDTFQSIFII